jgi:4a-hydroxytetrahydrobiopterin dehydratase
MDDTAGGEATMALADESCRRSARLPPDEIAELLPQLGAGWSVQEGQRLHMVVRTADFAQGLVLVNKIGALAEREDHHPDLLLAWGRVEITLWTHSEGGLTRADFVLAAQIDRLLPA